MFGERQGFIVAMILYGLGFLSYLIFLVSKKLPFSNYGSILVKIGFAFHTVALADRTFSAGRLPLASQYEFATSFAWGIVLCFIYFEYKYKFKTLGIFVIPLALLIISYAALQPSEIKPLMPALQSRWLFLHVSTAILSYGAFAIACSVSIMFIVRERFAEDEFAERYLPQLQKLDHISYKAISFGFFMLTVVIVSGAVWAESAWGRYWRWDPKETWSLITWIIYAIYLHIRLNRGWKNKKASWYAVIGFLAVLFTYVGVNTFLPGYHSYG
jgi:cytochrome c-type biogenesis protein CcsB